MISLPTPPKVIKEEGNKAVFEIEGLYPGYGTTIGSSMRRVLFSSLEGAAITQIRIKGAGHEFSTLPGVLEDVTGIILNLKQLRFRSFSPELQKAYIKIKSDKKVKGSDIELPSQLELVNKDQIIATLTEKKAELDIELTVERGLGYVPADRERSEKLEIGQITVDAIFTPIKAVNFRVENMRVGRRTDFDRLFIEIETDGTITPENAFNESARTLLDHFSTIITTKKEKPLITEEDGDSEGKKGSGDASETKVEALGLSQRTANILIKGGIKTVGGLLRKSKESVLSLDGMGDKGIKEVEKKIKKMGLELK